MLHLLGLILRVLVPFLAFSVLIVVFAVSVLVLELPVLVLVKVFSFYKFLFSFSCSWDPSCVLVLPGHVVILHLLVISVLVNQCICPFHLPVLVHIIFCQFF